MKILFLLLSLGSISVALADTHLSVTLNCGQRSADAQVATLITNYPVTLSSNGQTTVFLEPLAHPERPILLSLNSVYKMPFKRSSDIAQSKEEGKEEEKEQELSEVYHLTMAQVWNTIAFDYAFPTFQNGLEHSKKRLKNELKNISGLSGMTLEIIVNPDGTKNFKYWDPSTMDLTDQLPSEMAITMTQVFKHTFKRNEKISKTYFCIPTIN